MTTQEKAVRAQELRARDYTYPRIMKELGVSKATVVNYLKGYPSRPRWPSPSPQTCSIDVGA